MNIKLLNKVVKEKGIENQKELAKICKVSDSIISRLLHDDSRGITITTADKIKKGLKLTNDEAVMIFFGK